MDVLTHSNGTDHVQMIQLPPISSFDSLIRAASATSTGSTSTGTTIPVVVSSNSSSAHLNPQPVRSLPEGLLSYQFGSNGAGQTAPGTPSLRSPAFPQHSTHLQQPHMAMTASPLHYDHFSQAQLAQKKSGVEGTSAPTGTTGTTGTTDGEVSRHGGLGSNTMASARVPMSVPQLSMPATASSGTSSPSSSSSPKSLGSDNHSSSSLGAVARVIPNADSLSHSTASMVKKQTRKKKQCPICGLFFSNLSTHKSTHLSPETRPFKCDVCSRGFARSNDLIRHKKLHWKDDLNQESMDFVEKLKCLHQLKGTYKCPFNSNLINLDLELKGSNENNVNLPFETSNCHSTGVFSRCDTFKNHLKALHFEYPPGTKKKDRSNVAGHCKHCGKKFDNLEIWLKDHVGKECGYNFVS